MSPSEMRDGVPVEYDDLWSDHYDRSRAGRWVGAVAVLTGFFCTGWAAAIVVHVLIGEIL